jgi:ankyrin repeat protein
MDQTEGSETSAIINQTPGNYPKENLLYTTKLHAATRKRCVKEVQALLESKEDVNSTNEKGLTPLHIAAHKGYLEIVEVLLKFHADIDFKDESGRTPLHIAAHKGYFEIVEVLLKFHADIHFKDESGRTALHIAVEKSHLEVVKVLLNIGAAIESKGQFGSTPLHVAIQKGNIQVLSFLLQSGANVDSKDEYGYTPIHIAANKGHLESVEILLEFGADMDSKDEHGRTAIHIAAKEGREKVAIALLENGSDINIMTENNRTSLDFAMARIRSFYNEADNYSDDDYYDHGRDIRACENIVVIFKRHIVKLKTANLYVCKKNLLSISNNNGISDFQNECQEEIARMKSEKVSNTTVSFYDILTRGVNQLAKYAGNESIVQIFRSDDYKIKFPIYASMMNCNFRKGEKREELLEHGCETFHLLFPQLPYDCTEKVCSYLSDENLKFLIDGGVLDRMSKKNRRLDFLL